MMGKESVRVCVEWDDGDASFRLWGKCGGEDGRVVRGRVVKGRVVKGHEGDASAAFGRMDP